MKKLILITIALMNAFLLRGQDSINVKLELSTMSKDIIRSTTPILLFSDFNNYRGIDFTHDSLWIGRIVLNREQYWFDQSKLKDSLHSYYLEKIKDYDIDTAKLSKSPLKTYIPILVKIKNGRKIIIVDSNNNHDFSDDDLINYSFKIEKLFYENYDNINAFRVRFEKLEGYKINNYFMDFKLKPFDSAYTYKNKIDSISAVYFTPATYLRGILKLDNENYIVSVCKVAGIGFMEKSTFYSYSVVPENQRIRHFDWIKFNQNFKINNNISEIVQFSSDKKAVSFKIRPATKNDFGWNIGNYIPDSILSQYFSNDYTKKNYNIVNFWGSWCSPCIQEIPDIIKFNYSNSSSINLINIACENNQDGINKAKEIASNKRMNWKQIYSIINEGNSLSKLLNVTTFPTIIAFDHRGMIIAREVGLGNIETIKEKLKLN
jgi:thiol-disulfide isomerase/thioredoxin